MKKTVLFFGLFIILTTVKAQQNTMRSYQYDQEILNESGQRHGTLVYTSYLFDGLAYKHHYENGVLLQTTDFRFQIEGQKELIGYFKANLPYEGYFVYENEFEIPEIAYYEKSILMKKYTTTITTVLETEMTGMKPKMTETVYKDGKIWQGLNHKGYKMDGSSLLATEYFEKGAIANVDVWILAMHYAELIKVKFIPNGYEIYSEGKNDPEGDPERDTRPASIMVQFSDVANGNVSFTIANKSIAKYQFSKQDLLSKIDSTQKMIIYSLSEDDTILLTNKFNFEGNDKFEEEYSYSNKNIMAGFYTNLIYKPIPMLDPKKENDYLKILGFNDKILEKTLLVLNEEGKPFLGSFIEKVGATYRYSKYENTKVVAIKEKLSLEEIRKLLFDD